MGVSEICNVRNGNLIAKCNAALRNAPSEPFSPSAVYLIAREQFRFPEPHPKMQNPNAGANRQIAPAAFVQGCLKKFRSIRPDQKWSQSEHAAFLLFTIAQLLDSKPEGDESKAILAALSYSGLGGNASQFAQAMAKPDVALLPAREGAIASNADALLASLSL